MSTTTPDLQPSTKSTSGPRLAIALGLAAALWLGAFYGNNAVLLPARIEQIDADSKVAVVALLAILGSIVAMLANIVFGALSDLTRTRFGRRTPWMIAGSVGAAGSLLLLSLAESIPALIVCWCLFQLCLNALAAPLLALIPDRVAPGSRGTISAIYGVGSTVGIAGSQIFASSYVTNPQQGMVILAVAVLIAGPLVAILAPEVSNRDMPRGQFSVRALLNNFSFPTTDSRDFYLALAGRLLFMLGTYAISGYQLYILTDYVGMTTVDAGGVIATMATISLVTSVIFGAISGPISDRVGRRRIFIMGSSVLVAVGSLVPFVLATSTGMLIYATLAGIGTGIYYSVDQALNTDVLPDTDNKAKDLGILNMANTGGQILGPGVTSIIVSATGGYGLVFVAAAAIMLGSGAVIGPIRKAK